MIPKRNPLLLRLSYLQHLLPDTLNDLFSRCIRLIIRYSALDIHARGISQCLHRAVTFFLLCI